MNGRKFSLEYGFRVEMGRGKCTKIIVKIGNAEMLIEACLFVSLFFSAL